MAEVYLAVPNVGAFSKFVVIKKLRQHLSGDSDFVDMLMDEGRIAGLLNHVNLIQTIEVGESKGEVYLVMEYLDGQPLHKIVRAAGDKVPLALYLNVLADVLRGLDYAHELTDLNGAPLNIVHRDATPHNIFVTYQGVVKVVDFGIAKALGRATETRYGVVKGKAAYISPEQASGAEIDRRADIYAVGVILYEALTRRRMWKGVNDVNILLSLVANRVRTSPKELNPSVDDQLDRFCRRALAHSPDGRYPTAREMESDLRAYIAKKGLLMTQQQMGTYVSNLFAAKRAATAKVIEGQLAQLRTEIAAGPVTRLPAARPESASTPDDTGDSGPMSEAPSGGSAPSPPVGDTPPSDSSLQPETDTAAQLPQRPVGDTKTIPMPPARSGRSWRIALIMTALALTSLTAAITIYAFRPKAERRPARKESPAPSTKPITVTLRATPLETRFSIDDGPQLDNPFMGLFPRDGRPHVIRASAQGYSVKQETVVFGEDVTLRFALSTASRAGK
jgi:serine/threonine-protein kinase